MKGKTPNISLTAQWQTFQTQALQVFINWWIDPHWLWYRKGLKLLKFYAAALCSALTGPRQNITGCSHLQALRKLNILLFLWRFLPSTKLAHDEPKGGLFICYMSLHDEPLPLLPPAAKEWLNLVAARSTEFNQERVLENNCSWQKVQTNKSWKIWDVINFFFFQTRMLHVSEIIRKLVTETVTKRQMTNKNKKCYEQKTNILAG